METTVNGRGTAIFPAHMIDLQRSGITEETAREAGIYSEGNRDRLAALLNRKSWPARLGSGMVIPIRDASGTVVLNRVKPDRPQVNGSGQAAKYISPSGVALRVYFPPGVHHKIAEGATEVIITEGEKKSLAAVQAGFCCIALLGVDCWRSKRQTTLMADLELSWAGRTAYIAFDSDAATNSRVIENESLLADQLRKRGAIVKIIRFEGGSNGEKVGLDDFLVANGAGELRRLMDRAEDPQELEPESYKSPCGEADPADIAAQFRKRLEADGQCRLRYWRGTFWYWRGGGYCELTDADIRAKLVEAICENYFQVKRGDVSNAIMHLQSQTLLPSYVESPAWLAPKQSTDPPPIECVATKSGVVHLPSLATTSATVILPTPRFFTTAAVGYPFDPQAGRPAEWLRFLDSIWPDDEESISTLQQFFGYSLTADTSQQKLLMIVGPKRSGKGTILRVWRDLIGSANVTAPTLSGLGERFGLAPLVGKLLAIISDARLSGRVDQASVVERILSVTGEDAQTIDRKHLAPVTTKLSTRFVIVSNELPRLSDSSGALVSRMILLRTTNSFFGAEDHGLTDRLLSELPAIFLWAANGWQSLRQRGYFVQPESSRELLQELDDLASPISAFVREKCDVDPDSAIYVDDLYAAWKNWCEASGRVRVTDKPTFGRDLLAYVPQVRKTRPRCEGGERRQVYEGITSQIWS